MDFVLEFQPSFTGCFSECGDTAMVNIAATVEYDFRDALFESALSDFCTDSLSCFDVAAVVLEPLVLGACRDERYALLIIDDLRIDVCEAAIYVEARTSAVPAIWLRTRR